MACNINIQNIGDAIVDWTPVGEITGFADGEDSIAITWADDGKSSMKVAADGTTGTLTVNRRTNGTVKLKLNAGSPFVQMFRQIWQNSRSTVGTMSVTNAATGESHLMECAALEMMPPVHIGSTVVDHYEFSFLFLRSTSTPSTSAATLIRGGINVSI